jgi:hypothetical protein
MPKFLKSFFPFRFSDNNFVCISCVPDTFPVHYSLVDLIILFIEEYKLSLLDLIIPFKAQDH